MGLVTSPDRLSPLACPGIPGARSQPRLGQEASILNIASRRSSRSRERAERSLTSRVLNPLLADSMVLSSHYRNHWLAKANTSRYLDELFDRHAADQRQLIDLMVERVETLKGRATVPSQVAEMTVIDRPQKHPADLAVLLSGLVRAHELVAGRGVAMLSLR